MPAVDFAAWVAPDLVLTLDEGRATFPVAPPSVEDAKLIMAAAVRAEVRWGLAAGPVPEEIEAICETIGDRHPGLGDQYDALVAAGVPQATIDRMSVYSVFFWARGKEYADSLATLFFAPRGEQPAPAGDAPRKVSSRPKTGRRTASANPTQTAGTRTTGRSQKT